MEATASLDRRWIELAEILTRYSTAVRPGERVLLSMVEPDTFPLVRALHAAIVRAGGYPHVELQSALLERDLLFYGNEEQISWVPEVSRWGLEWADVYIGVRGASNPHALQGIPPEPIAARRKAAGVLSALRTERTRWVLVRVPNDAMAQQAQMGVDEMMQTFFDATLMDWQEQSRRWEPIQALFAGASRVRITAPGTDLRMDTAGRRFLLDDGHVNMPGGELYSSPIEDSAAGTIAFNLPGAFAGRRVPGIALRFESGRVVSARADDNEDLLRSLIAMDEGAPRVGEIGIGLNAGLTRFCGDPLLDEKMLGTAHIALGRSYGACGGTNRSALHWDLVTDLGREGQIWADDRLVFENGTFAISG